jgi:Flp pilus assembly pilin Flp
MRSLFRSKARRLAREQSGATLAEFVMIAGLIGLVALVSIRKFGSSLLGVTTSQGKTVLCIPGQEGVAASTDCGGNGGGGPSPSACTGGLCLNGNCFVAGTPVTTPEGTTPIEQVREGDLVVSRDERTGVSRPERVVRTFVTPGAALVAVRLRESSDEIRATPGHRFYTRDRGWMPAEELRENEELVDVANAPLHVASVTPLAQRETVYNFEVAETHTYFVGSASVWVHNPTGGGSCNGGGPGGGGSPWTVHNLPASCQNFGDVPPGSSVFWTGGQMTQAQQWASANPGHTVLENTACYAAIQQGVGAQAANDWAGSAKPIFNESSQNYAAHASGVVNVVVPAGYNPYAPPPNGDNVWSQVEYPTLNSNPQVTQICYQIQNTPPSTVCVAN